MKIKTVRTILLILLIPLGFLFVQTPASGYMLNCINGVRPAGMGEAFVSVADDANAVPINPAGLSLIESPVFCGMYSDLYSNLNAGLFTEVYDRLGYNFVSLAVPLELLGGFGLAWTNFTSAMYGENALTLAYGKRIWHPYTLDLGLSLDIGIAVKALHWMVVKNKYTTKPEVYPYQVRDKYGMTADAGILITVLRDLRLGISMSNIIPANMGIGTTEYVSDEYRLGGSYHYTCNNTFINSVLVAAELSERNNVYTPKVGVESWMGNNQIALRAGVNTNRITAGLGFVPRMFVSPLLFQADYAFSYPFQVWDTLGSHRVGLTVQWNQAYFDKITAEKRKQKEIAEDKDRKKRKQEMEAFRQTIMAQSSEELEALKNELRKTYIMQTTASTATHSQKNSKVAGNNKAEIIVGYDRNILAAYGDYRAFQKVADRLQAHIKTTTQVDVIRKEYSTFEKLIYDFQQGELDVVVVPGGKFADLGSNDSKALIRLKREKDFTEYCLIIREDNKIRTLQDLQDKRIGYFSLSSLLGLKQYFFAGIPAYKSTKYFKRTVELEDVESGIISLMKEDVDVIVGYEYVMNKYKKYKDSFPVAIKKLCTAETLPDAPVFVRTNLHKDKQEKIAKIRAVLLQAHTTPDGRLFLEFFKSHIMD
jgi:ABC-type phosphate/phosphonate transport system substrate-binding protein